MAKRIFYYLAILLFLPLDYFFLSKNANSQLNENKSTSLSVDYLKQIPDSNYIIGPGDSILIIVSRDYPELNSTVTIDGEGTINLPKLAKIFVQNLSTNELKDLLNKAYKEYVKYPSVEVVIKSYRPIKVLVQGEVNKPGLINLQGSLTVTKKNSNNEPIPKKNLSLENHFNYYFPTVLDAIRESGGITPFSDLTKVQLLRRNSFSSGNEMMYTTLNFEQVLLGDRSQNLRIYDSDIIKIPKTDKKNDHIIRKATLAKINPSFASVFVFGRVNSSGTLKVPREAVLNDAIEMAGAKFLKGPLKFVRYNNDGSIDRRKFRYKPNAKRGAYNNPSLKDGDFMLVGSSGLANSAEVINEVTSPFVGILSTYGLIKALQD